LSVSLPLVSCIMPTANRRRFVPRAIECFLAQDYAEKELLILDDGEERIEDLVPRDPRVRYVRGARRQPVGTKRNAACNEARGELIAHWDDDDWSAPWRLSYQVAELARSGADVCGLDRVLFADAGGGRAWEYVYPKGGQPWVYGATLCYRKAFWRGNPFPDVNVGEDARFVWNARGARILALERNDFFVGLVHEGNTSPKQTRDARWQARPPQPIQALTGAAPARPAALVSAALGIGDILRVTPLIRVLDRLGYRVDVLLAPDYPETLELLRGAPEIARLVHYPEFRRNRGARALPELADARYEVATFTHWSAPFAAWVRSKASHAFAQAEWLKEGDAACVRRIAGALGWRGELPEPFAMASARDFGLPPGTVALHPGCKPDWPWKKWHGFDELARRLPSVAVVGAPQDLDNRGTYFQRVFEWPAHARDFVGRLGLADTAALIRQCAALVSNDSGLMHLAVALGVPAYGVFGITSPQREAMPSRFMIPVSKGLACEPACRREAWGRRDCERHLECLKTLGAEEVLARLQLQRNDAMETETPIRVNYYGYVFDSTGYGQAARGYIRALQAAGVQVSVVDIGAQPRQVPDPLVASLLGRDPAADFHIFHGIPSQWAHLAYPLRNTIALTVWETDTMPQRWRNPLAHAADVWLPSSFNVEVFSRALGRAAFRLPHTVPPGGLNGAHHPALDLARLGIGARDFVFYGVFEWQDRKNPRGTLEAFLRAFPEEGEPVLLLKSNPGALAAAQRALQEARGATGSRGRVVLCCEAWSEGELQALHARGDCYVSLHKGEGWGYPLFEAACRGKAVVATGYSGPLDYLDAARHWLVRHNAAPVQQQYAYYHPSMRWAEPDLGHAAEGMKRAYELRKEASGEAKEAAARLQAAYSFEAVGAAARERLASLLKRTDRARWQALERGGRARRASPAVPIPGDWYDAEYFEHGLKSNWESGYSWPLFKGVFEEAAHYLIEMFPEAESFLDAGCAKGFLVRALRERGREAFGFDHSRWAIEHAEPQARPYLQLAGVDDVRVERDYDVLVAFSLLETLTEAQIDGFLRRGRERTRQALIAFIPTVDEKKSAPPADLDLSHITLRKRAWWHERFLGAGWRQDALHRIVEARCRTHPTPARMKWDIYVYAP
jgi:ADP-heptose:LPS heptosyltransferase/2-polyprenyl-3-methyl-5-hydroxy-6-metoxy-1,4-benzoquinol methylase